MISLSDYANNLLRSIIPFLRNCVVLVFFFWCNAASGSLIQGRMPTEIQGRIATDTLLELDVSWSWTTFGSKTYNLYFKDSRGKNSFRSTNTKIWRLRGSPAIINNTMDDTLKVVIHIEHLGFNLNPDHNHIGDVGGLYSLVKTFNGNAATGAIDPFTETAVLNHENHEDKYLLSFSGSTGKNGVSTGTLRLQGTHSVPSPSVLSLFIISLIILSVLRLNITRKYKPLTQIQDNHT